jgi:hypothetical protein
MAYFALFATFPAIYPAFRERGLDAFNALITRPEDVLQPSNNALGTSPVIGHLKKIDNMFLDALFSWFETRYLHGLKRVINMV